MEIRELTSESQYAAWDRFVAAHPQATFFHRAAWRDVIGEAFGHPTFFLYAVDGDQVTGVLSLAQVRSRFFGHKLISLPFCVYGGPVAIDDATSDSLVARASAIARRLDVDYLELRSIRARPGLAVSDRYVTFRRTIDPDPDVNMKAIPRKQRAMIRKGSAKGLSPRFGSEVDSFYRVYAESLRNLGTPVLPRRYFTVLKRVFADDCEVMTVGTGAETPALSAVMSFYFRDQVLPYYGGGTDLAREYHAYDYMYWELMAHAANRGSRLFDFGRSRQGTGSYRFKTHWGFEPEPLQYQYDLVMASSLPNFTPDNPRYHALIGLWKKMPLRLTTTLGPWLARNLG